MKNKAASLINIGSLAVGMAVAMLIGLWIWDEVSDNHTLTQNGNYMEPAITDMLSVKILKGSSGSLNDPSFVLLSQATAKAIFGTDDPLNRVIKIDKKIDAKVKINPLVSAHDVIGKISAIFKKYDPTTAFNYQFIDEAYAKKFDNEERIGKLAGCFAGLGLFISCLGLFGMALFMAEQRIKEIGVRFAFRMIENLTFPL